MPRSHGKLIGIDVAPKRSSCRCPTPPQKESRPCRCPPWLHTPLTPTWIVFKAPSLWTRLSWAGSDLRVLSSTLSSLVSLDTPFTCSRDICRNCAGLHRAHTSTPLALAGHVVRNSQVYLQCSQVLVGGNSDESQVHRFQAWLTNLWCTQQAFTHITFQMNGCTPKGKAEP